MDPNNSNDSKPNKFLTKIAENFKDMQILCNACHYEGAMSEFTSGCPKCGEKSALVPKTQSGQSLEQLGYKKVNRGVKIAWLSIISILFSYAAYNFLELKYYIIFNIVVLAIDIIIYFHGKK